MPRPTLQRPNVGAHVRITATAERLIREGFSSEAAEFFSGRIVRVTGGPVWVEFASRPGEPRYPSPWQMSPECCEPAVLRPGDQVRLLSDADRVRRELCVSSQEAEDVAGRVFPVTPCPCGCRTPMVETPAGLLHALNQIFEISTHADPQLVAQPIVSSRPPPRVRRAKVRVLNLP